MMPLSTDLTSQKSELTLLVLAAGMGSRFGGLKQITPVGPDGETVMDYSIFDAIKAGFTRVVFVIRKDFEDEFRKNLGERFAKHIAVDYAFQSLDDLPEPFQKPEERTKPWGTAHAVLAARNVINGPFAVINADDYYGPQAYKEIASFLRKGESSSNGADEKSPAHFCMVAYELGHTLSENGTVSRGICNITLDGYLSSITEKEKIRPSGAQAEALNGNNWEPLSLDTPVSMNIMGFTTKLFEILKKRFSEFLKTRISESGSECYLPESLSISINEKTSTVEVKKSTDEWMGITYPEDRNTFVEKIIKLHRDGRYPTPLWRGES